MESSSLVKAQQNALVRSIVWDIVWTVLTCGLYNIYVQYKQIQAVNAMLKTQKYEFWPWLLFTALTCGLYHVYHEYRMSQDIVTLCEGSDTNLPWMTVVLAIFGFSVVADAIQQTHINKYYGSHSL